MKLDIPYYIRQVLREQRMVYVPGIGTFRLNQLGASFNDDKSQLSPPSLHITFDDADSSDQSLLKYILDTGLITEAKAKKKLEQYTQAAFNKLLNVDVFKIDGVGRILKRTGEDKVSFEADLKALTREFGDLRPIKMNPVARISEQQPVPLAFEPTSPKVEDSGSFLPRILALSLLLIALWFLGRYFYNNYFDQGGAEKSELVDPAVLDEQNRASEKELEEKYEAIDELIDPENAEKTKDGEDAGANGMLSSIEERPASTTQNDEATISGSTTSGNEGDDQGNEVTNNTSQETTNRYADILPESGECIIIVGSFKKSRNAVKMSSLLEQKGYEVYQSQYQDFNRVGLKYECIDEDLVEYLQDIRQNISKLAWYLDPDLEVPYKKM